MRIAAEPRPRMGWQFWKGGVLRMGGNFGKEGRLRIGVAKYVKEHFLYIA